MRRKDYWNRELAKKSYFQFKCQLMNNRRLFLKNLSAIGATSLVPTILHASGLPALNWKENEGGGGRTIFFQGDSITDGNRGRNNDWNHVMGHGYQYIISSKLWFDYPKKGYHFFNRGISGNKVTDLAARWQSDTIDLKPDVLSILVGINDTAVFINGDKNFDVAHYQSGFTSLLQQTKAALPNIQLVLCEPFVLPVGKVKDKWEDYSREIGKRQMVVKQLSKDFKAVFVPFQTAFDKALQRAPAEYWIWDGVHPMPAGHELMAREWLRAAGHVL
jgi:lysophospholipase L1-like esterase